VLGTRDDPALVVQLVAAILLRKPLGSWLPWLAELQPELFIEMSPELAQEKGIHNTDVVIVSTPRASIRAKALVTKRMRPFVINGKTVHQVGMPWHWGYKGIAVGDVVNDLTSLVGDPNVNIHEGKVFVCNVERSAEQPKVEREEH